jgi:hypothetical protein
VSRKIIVTKDGSPSIEWKEGVTYHSTFGALQESQHIFIGEGWKTLQPASIRIFELGRPDLFPLFRQLHTCEWDTWVTIGQYFSLYKSRDKWPEHELRQAAELVYYDAFDPVEQPELWTEDVFRRLARQLAPGAVLVTYCCKGAIRRALQAAGFQVEKRPGPPGKREVVRARLIPPGGAIN